MAYGPWRFAEDPHKSASLTIIKEIALARGGTGGLYRVVVDGPEKMDNSKGFYLDQLRHLNPQLDDETVGKLHGKDVIAIYERSSLDDLILIDAPEA